MARTQIAPAVPSKLGGDLVFQAFDNVNGIVVLGFGTILLIFKGQAQDRVVTLRSSQVVDGDLKVPDRLITVPAGGFTIVGPFNPLVYDQGGGAYNFDCPNAVQFAAVSIQ